MDGQNSKYGSMTIPQLKTELKKWNAKVSGKKAALIERLEFFERNSNGKKIDEVATEYSISTPDASKYKDLNSDSKVIKLDRATLDTYLTQFDKELDAKSVHLYNDRFLKLIRLSQDGGCSFFRSQCRAEMRKSVVYTTDVVIDENGLVSECQCECAAGMGPGAHCKHVCTLLYGIVQFCQTGIVKTEQTCTEKLQTFHHCKQYKGSPLKAKDLNIGDGETDNVIFDPRPPQFRNAANYQDFFRNTCLNSPNCHNMPITQTFPPANKLAVARDHDYLTYTPEDQFLRDMRVTDITEDDRLRIESETIGQSDNKTWYEERRKRMQSSNFGRICKATDKTDFSKLAMSMTVSRELKVPAVVHGHKYENVAVYKFCKDTGVEVEQCGIFVSTTHPYFASSPDRVVDKKILVEVKCPYAAKDKLISTVTVPYLKMGTNGLYLDPKHDYMYQIQGQLYCSDRQVCQLVVYTLCDSKYITIHRDDTFIKTMLGKLEHFFTKYFKAALLEKYFYKSYE